MRWIALIPSLAVPPGDATVVAVTGTSGGTGASTIALNLAYEIALLKKVPCILIELSLRRGVMAEMLDISPESTISTLLGASTPLNISTVRQALTKYADNLFVLTGPYRGIELGEFDLTRVVQLIDLAKKLASVLILDIPCTFDDHYFQSLAVAHQIVLVAEQTVPSIRGAHIMCEALRNPPPFLVINRYDPANPDSAADRLRKILRARELATVVTDESVVDATNNGLPIRLQDCYCCALADVDRIVHSLVSVGRDRSIIRSEPTTAGSPSPTMSLT